MRNTLYDKIWRDHLVEEAADGTCLLYVDRHLVHEVDSPQAFTSLRRAGRQVKAPARRSWWSITTCRPLTAANPTRTPGARRRSPILPRMRRCSASNISANSTGGRVSATSSAPSRAL